MAIVIFRSQVGIDPLCQFPMVALNQDKLQQQITTTTLNCKPCMIPVASSSSSSSSSSGYSSSSSSSGG